MKRLEMSTGTAFVIVLVNVALVYSANSAGKSKGEKGAGTKGDFEDENYGVKYASKCEVCKIVTGEVEHLLNTKFKSSEVIDTGYNYLQDSNKHKKKTVYEKSMIRLQEAMESTCGAMLEYNIHKERTDWTRFARGQSQTFKTLHGLKNKGVKVDLGMPHEMWDKPSAEITNLKSQCESFIELHEDYIEKWYKKGSQVPLEDFICAKRLKKKDRDCLKVVPKEDTTKKVDKADGDSKKDNSNSKITSSTEEPKPESSEKSQDAVEEPKANSQIAVEEPNENSDKPQSIIEESKKKENSDKPKASVEGSMEVNPSQPNVEEPKENLNLDRSQVTPEEPKKTLDEPRNTEKPKENSKMLETCTEGAKANPDKPSTCTGEPKTNSENVQTNVDEITSGDPAHEQGQDKTKAEL